MRRRELLHDRRHLHRGRVHGDADGLHVTEPSGLHRCDPPSNLRQSRRLQRRSLRLHAGDGRLRVGRVCGRACQTDPCANVTCTTPPSVCYDAAGTCSQGSCNYPTNHAACNDGNDCTDSDTCNGGVCSGTPKLCNTPPADSCADASTATVHDHVGTCAGGACSYAPHYVSCSAGCIERRLQSVRLDDDDQQHHPDPDSVWGTSATSVWAGGLGGTAVYYNGTQWQVRPTPTGLQQRHPAVDERHQRQQHLCHQQPDKHRQHRRGHPPFRRHQLDLLRPSPGRWRTTCDLHCRVRRQRRLLLGLHHRLLPERDGVSLSGHQWHADAHHDGGRPGMYNATQCGIQVFSPTNIVATAATQVFQMDSVAKKATAIGGASFGQTAPCGATPRTTSSSTSERTSSSTPVARPGPTSPPASTAW